MFSPGSQAILGRLFHSQQRKDHPMTQPLPIAQTTETTVEAVAPVAPTDALLLRRLGIDTLPSHETLYLPLDRLIVPGAEQIARAAARLTKSITQVGILQPPSVMLVQGGDIHAEDATFQVIAGRRRVLAARLAGLIVIKCEAYETSTTQLASLLTLIENEQRSAAWVKEVEALRKLIDEKVGLTLDDLAAFGFDRASLRERLKIAHLPVPLIERVLLGSINRETARKLIRLTRAQQERIAALATAGEDITVEVVKHALRTQIDAGLAPMQEQLQEAWTRLPTPVSASLQVPSSPIVEPSKPAPTTSLAQLVADLRRFEQSDDYQTVPQAVRSLTTALMQQAEVCVRTAQTNQS
jgi:ParB/RepB/Spo0J family partition protein